MSTADVCTEVQRVISAAFDSDIPDPAALEAAKEHCRTCTGCAGFVNLLAEVRRLPAPEIPAPVLERTLAAVAAEAAATAAAAAASADTDSASATPNAPRSEGATADDARATAAPTDTLAPGQPIAAASAGVPTDTARPQWHSWAPWAAAAALFFVAAGLMTAQGVSFLLSPSPDGPTVAETVTLQDPGATSREAPAESDAIAPTPGSPGADAFDGSAPITGPAYVTLSGRVYRYDAPADLPLDTPSSGTLTSALDTGTAATQRSVFDDPNSDAIIVAGEDETYLRFVPVNRTFQGRPYALRSQAIVAFGVWPTLPDAIPRPSNPQGVPELVPVGSDDSGVAVFARPGTDPSSGFAVAPGTPATDPTGGNPEWTWWEPVTQ